MRKFQDSYLYAITPSYTEKSPDQTEFLTKIKESLEEGIDILQLRLKKGEKDRLILNIGWKLRELTREKDVLLIINDRLDFCQILEADGLHLGQDDIPLKEARKIIGYQKIIGISTHNLSQAYEAEKEGADYLGYGPCYLTTTKEDLSPMVKLQEMGELKKNLKIPFFAIGGLSLKNIPSVLSAGANRLAICAGIYQSGNIRETTQKIRESLFIP